MCLRATTASACIFKPTLDRDGFKLNHDRALDLWWSMIFFGKPVSTFPDHALRSHQDEITKLAAPSRHLPRSIVLDRRFGFCRHLAANLLEFEPYGIDFLSFRKPGN